jgi:hypothetical protein
VVGVDLEGAGEEEVTAAEAAAEEAEIEEAAEEDQEEGEVEAAGGLEPEEVDGEAIEAEEAEAEALSTTSRRAMTPTSQLKSKVRKEKRSLATHMEWETSWAGQGPAERRIAGDRDPDTTSSGCATE